MKALTRSDQSFITTSALLALLVFSNTVSKVSHFHIALIMPGLGTVQPDRGGHGRLGLGRLGLDGLASVAGAHEPGRAMGFTAVPQELVQVIQTLGTVCTEHVVVGPPAGEGGGDG